jgi:hypothetical protein
MQQFKLQPLRVSVLNTKEKQRMVIRRQPLCGNSVNTVKLQIVEQSYLNYVTYVANINGPKIHTLL